MKKATKVIAIFASLVLAGAAIFPGCGSSSSPAGPSSKSIIRDTAGAPAAHAEIFIDDVSVGFTDEEGEVIEPLNAEPGGPYLAVVVTSSGEQIEVEIVVDAGGEGEVADGEEDSLSEESDDDSEEELSEDSADEESEESDDESSEESDEEI